MAARGIKWIIRRPMYGTHAAGSHLRRNPRFITRSEGQRVYSPVLVASALSLFLSLFLPLSLSLSLFLSSLFSSLLSSPLLSSLLFFAVPFYRDRDCCCAPCPGRAIAFDTAVCPLSARLTIAGLIKRRSMFTPRQEFLVFKSPTCFRVT